MPGSTKPSDDISIADNSFSVASAVASDSVLVSPIIDLTQNEQDKVPPQPANPEAPRKRQRVGLSKLWAGIAISVLIVLELCAGSAGFLPCAIRDAGFDACPIDRKLTSTNLRCQLQTLICMSLSF